MGMVIGIGMGGSFHHELNLLVFESHHANANNNAHANAIVYLTPSPTNLLDSHMGHCSC